MCTFIFEYEDKSKLTFPHVKQVKYSLAGTGTVVDGDSILTHNFPVNVKLSLFSDDFNVSVSANQLRCITVKKEG